jgi:hypothetical protein
MDQILATFRGTENILYNHAKLKKRQNCYDSRHYSIQVSGNRVYQALAITSGWPTNRLTGAITRPATSLEQLHHPDYQVVINPHQRSRFDASILVRNAAAIENVSQL